MPDWLALKVFGHIYIPSSLLSSPFTVKSDGISSSGSAVNVERQDEWRSLIMPDEREALCSRVPSSCLFTLKAFQQFSNGEWNKEELSEKNWMERNQWRIIKQQDELSKISYNFHEFHNRKRRESTTSIESWDFKTVVIVTRCLHYCRRHRWDARALDGKQW